LSTTAQIRTAWLTVWQHATTQAITDKINFFDIAKNIKGTTERELIRSEQRINFFQCLYRPRETQLSEIRGSASSGKYKHVVEVIYFLEKDLTDASFGENDAVDSLEAIDALILSSLGTSWTSTVSFYQVTGVITPEMTELDTKDVWRLGFQYTAFSHA
jgi:hypothetical protein